MATSGVKSLIKQNKEEEDRDLKCRICLTVYKKPKLLPCLHTFCEDCLWKYCCDEEYDNMFPCPLCSRKFGELPDGVDKLPDNQFMVRLIYQKCHQDKKCNCDPCRGNEEDIKADSFCMECRQSLCHGCAWFHSKLYKKQHKLVSIGEKPTDYELQRLMSCSFCAKHGNKELELYCCDCKELICALCHVADHNKHDCRVSHDIARQKKELSENDRKIIKKLSKLVSERKQRLVKAKEDLLQQVSSAESSLRKSVDIIRKLLDIYEKEMLEELNSMKKNEIKELESEQNLEELDYTTLDSFLTYSRMIMKRGTDCEIIRAAGDLHRRALELIKDQKKKDAMSHDKTQLKFIESMTPMKEDIKKLLGKIVYKPTDKNTAGRAAWLRSSTKVNIIQAYRECIRAVTVVDDEIFVIVAKTGEPRVKVFDSHSLTASRDISIPEMQSPTGLAGCSYNKALYISDIDLNYYILRFDLTKNSVTRLKMRGLCIVKNLSMTNEHNVLGTVKAYDERERNLVVEYTSKGELLREIRLDRNIEYALQTVQLSSDQFIICYKFGTSPLNRVSLINTEGQIIKSYGREEGGGENRSGPFSIAIDYNSKHVFVPDPNGNGVLMLDADLTYVGQVHTPPYFRLPDRLYFDSSTDRLIASDSQWGRVLVISPSH